MSDEGSRERRRDLRPWEAFLGAFWPFILGSMLIAGGIAAIVIAYFGAAGTVYVGLQVPYLISGGFLGLALVIVGSALMVVHSQSRQARLTRRLLAFVEHGAGRLLTDGRGVTGGSNGSAPAPGPGTVMVAAGGARWFHRPGCLLLEGRESQAITEGEARTRELSPCRLCDPVLAPKGEAGSPQP